MPSWRPTPTMLAEVPRLPPWVREGIPCIPWGCERFTSAPAPTASMARITLDDWQEASKKGCIRMYNRDVLDLYPRAQIGAKVTVTWQRFDVSADYRRHPLSRRSRG